MPKGPLPLVYLAYWTMTLTAYSVGLHLSPMEAA